MSRKVDLKDKEFGRLKGIKPTGNIIRHSTEWEFICKCGNKCFASANDVMWAGKTSCGCAKEEEDVKHAAIARKSQLKEFGTDLVKITTNNINKNNTSGIRGVSWRKKEKLWVARIQFQKKTYSLGYYHNLEDAIKARKTAEQELYGNFLKWYEQEYPDKYMKLVNRKS